MLMNLILKTVCYGHFYTYIHQVKLEKYRIKKFEKFVLKNNYTDKKNDSI